VCPKCRATLDDPPASSAIVRRCPDDGLAFVARAALAEADGDPLLGSTVAGRFVVLAKLGAGSMGTVYRARHEAMARWVALKVLRSDRAIDGQAKQRFAREARAMSVLTSPHTVTVFDFGEIAEPPGEDDFGIGTSLYLAMELCEGESLGARLKRARRLAPADAARVARHALLSLAEAHEKGVIHRDLKPDNLFLCRPPTGEAGDVCKLLDFGIAKLATEATGAVDALETQAGTVFGTPRYMSPEQAQGRPLDARSDLYSLGVICYHMLVGRPPFVDDDAVVVMARHIKSQPTPPLEAAPDADLPPAFSALVMRVLAKDPADRPPSARAFLEELDAALAEDAARAPTPATTAAVAPVVRDDLDSHLPDPPSARARRRPPRAVLTTLGLVVGGVAGALLASSALRGAPGPAARAREGIAAVAGGLGRAASAAAGSSAAVASAPAPVTAASAPPPSAASASSTTRPARSAGTAPSPRAPSPAPAPVKKAPTYSRFEP
jgi:serine/threonine-protein kinase